MGAYFSTDSWVRKTLSLFLCLLIGVPAPLWANITTTKACANTILALAGSGATVEETTEKAGKDQKLALTTNLKVTGLELSEAMESQTESDASSFGTTISTAVLRQAQQSINGLFTSLYREPRTNLAPISDPILDHQNALRRLITHGEGVPIPRSLIERAETAAHDLEKERRALETKISVFVEHLQGEYRPRFFVTIVNAIREVIANGRIVGNTSDYLEPLIRIVRQNSSDFLAVMSHSAMLDETQDELVTKLLHLINANILTKDARKAGDSALFNAIDELLFCRARRWTGKHTSEPISEKGKRALRTLVQILREVAESDTNTSLDIDESLATLLKDHLVYATTHATTTVKENLLDYVESLADTLEREEAWEAKLTAARREFAMSRIAARVAYVLLDEIARPDGFRELEGNNLLRLAWLDSLANRGHLRIIVATALSDWKRFYDPALRRHFEVEISPIEALQKYGTENVDQFLVAQIHRSDRINNEFHRARIAALEEELRFIRGQMTQRQLEKAEAVLTRIASGSLNHTVQQMASYASGTLSGGLFEAIQKEVNRESPSGVSNAGPAGSIQSLPGRLVEYLRTVKIPWKSNRPLPFRRSNRRARNNPPPTSTPPDTFPQPDPMEEPFPPLEEDPLGDPPPTEDPLAPPPRVPPPTQPRPRSTTPTEPYYSSEDASRYLLTILNEVETRCREVNQEDRETQRKAREAKRSLSDREVRGIAKKKQQILRTVLHLLQHLERSFIDRASQRGRGDTPIDRTMEAQTRANAVATFLFQLTDFPSIRRMIANDDGALLRRFGRSLLDDALARLYRSDQPRMFGNDTFRRFTTGIRRHAGKIITALVIIILTAGAAKLWLPPVSEWFGWNRPSQSQVEPPPTGGQPELPSGQSDPPPIENDPFEEGDGG